MGIAQNTYTEVQYEYRVDSSVYYGTSTNYAGNPVDLYMDIYKPIGDDNTSRPAVVLAFGGAWIGGDKRNSDVTSIAPWFAKRGFVVAAIDYRLGFHPSTGSGSNYVTCPAVTAESNCVYPADSNEVIRAMYRGMQDFKGAIRFLKARFQEDSTCTVNFFATGVSAGGFNALAATFVDDESEKPAAAFELESAPGPAVALDYCNYYHNLSSAAISLERPDLGSIEGTIAQNGYTSDVAGVFNLIGGIMWNYFEVENGTSPLLYLHHQTSDLIVSCGTAPLLSSLSYNCLDPFGFLSCNHVWNMPWARGSCGIETLINDEGYNINLLSSISQTGGPNCVQDPPGHSVVAPATRVSEIVEFVSQRISENENPGCNLSTSGKAGIINQKEIVIYPNPAATEISIKNVDLSVPSRVVFRDPAGRPIKIESLLNNTCRVESLQNGLYLLEIQNGNRTYFSRIIIQHTD